MRNGSRFRSRKSGFPFHLGEDIILVSKLVNEPYSFGLNSREWSHIDQGPDRIRVLVARCSDRRAKVAEQLIEHLVQHLSGFGRHSRLGVRIARIFEPPDMVHIYADA